MKITLEELRAWVAVVDSGSITAAAEQLEQTTSGISRALSRLESKLQTTLMHRTTRRLALTDEGAIFLEHARQILTSVERAEEQIARRRETPAGRLRINANTPFMLHVIVPLLAEFRQRYPQIELELNTDDIVIDLLEQQTDIAIRIGELRDSTLRARVLGSSATRLVASPDYLAKHGIPDSVAALSQHQLIGFSQLDTHNIWPVWQQEGEFLRIKPTLTASSGETLRQLALQGLGIVRLSDFVSREDREQGRLMDVLASETRELRLPVHAVYYRNQTLSSRVTCFLDFLQEKIQRQQLI
ncbi:MULTISPECIES: LysR substrate-binding domain-containing protein [Pantoea]|uniref:LysR family transcriptional regulator n=1 Tax=Pantoea eucrina TaxID=472693 RepID=A0ABS1Z350_9GAMM|nr:MULTISPECIES: LysR substrate-binding domain-containing protein [Pantoea]AIX52089.1 LysR family transcriptional regulator [Pantoea sp. PSNIH1]NIE71127.1 LysR family transcriptional regulator [Pantoea sp. Acro-807]KAA6046605.1 LysR family transcriptional regulator [Pantoea sp. Bo_7]KAA6091834.1 LysR family transcriptional regulator [Pantoea sp. Bo_10]MBM0746824.1 LysR family transcriptional regulator [Pantoea eucrina]